MTPARGDVERAGRSCSGCRRHAAAGQPADVIVLDLDAPWVLDPAELKSKCKNTPFDEAQAAGPGGAHHRCRPHGLRIRLTAASPGATAERCANRSSSLFLACAAALAFGYLLGSIPFGLILTTARRHAATSARSARAISAPPTCCAPAARGLPPRRCSATRSRARSPCWIAASLVRPRTLALLAGGSAPFSAICFRSGSASRAARASRPISACCSALAWPAALAFALIWLAVAALTPLFLARRAHSRALATPVCFAGSSANAEEAQAVLRC